MTVMNDLRQAILDVLESAEPSEECYEDRTMDRHSVASDRLRVLQAEYNIYFVEPHEPQVNEV